MATTALPMPVTSVGDMLSSVPTDLFDGIDLSGSGDISVEDTSLEAGDDGDDAIDVPEPIGGEADAPADDESVQADKPEDDGGAPEVKNPDTTPAADEELPEGVRKGKDRKGKEGYFLEENRYKTFHGNHQIVQQGAEILGEPLTIDALKLRNEAYLGQERMFNNLTSGDPAAQADVLGYILREMTGAREAGEVGLDPTVPFAESFLSTIKEQAPDAYANVRLINARDLIGDMFETAAQNGDPHLFSAAQHFARTVAGIGAKPTEMTDMDYASHVRESAERMGIPFFVPAEMQKIVKTEPVESRLVRENAELRAQLNGKTTTSTAAQYDAWARTNVNDVNKSVLEDAVKPALASVEGAWKDFKSDYQDLVVDRLHRLVTKDVRADEGLNQKVLELQGRAKRATSEQVRNQLGTQIKQLLINRANRAVEAHKPAVLKFAAESLKGRSDATHERRTGAQTRTVPKGPSAPVKQSLIADLPAFKNNVYDPKVAAAQAMKYMAALNR